MKRAVSLAASQAQDFSTVAGLAATAVDVGASILGACRTPRP